jgi:hypothetical protein
MSPGVVRRLCVGLIGLALLAAGPSRGEEKETVRVSVLGILATERNDKVDPRLTCIAKEIRKTHPELTGFQIGKMTRRSLAIGARETFELGGDQKAVVAVQHGADSDNRVEVKIAPPQMGEITYDTCCGKFFPIVTPVRTGDRDWLILAVRVQPCHGK